MNHRTLANAECYVEWNSGSVWHRDWRWFPKLEFRPDSMSGDLAARMLDAGDQRVAIEVPAEESIPLTRRDERVSLERTPVDAAFRRRHLHGPYRGRFYPRAVLSMLSGVGTSQGDDRQPFRVTDVDEDQVAVDLGHPLAGYVLSVGGRLGERLDGRHDGRGSCNDLITDLTQNGPGMQCSPHGATVDFAQPDRFSRDDSSQDDAFYRQPRLVQHIDRQAQSFVNGAYRRAVRPGDRVLDLMSSWVSHLGGIDRTASVTGLGMNAEELEANQRLDDFVVQDLNRETRLPWADASFDVVICTVSIEYLIRPYPVFEEVGRVLAPGGRFVVTFSDRWFPPKVVRLWTLLHPFERIGLVLDYFRRSGGFTALRTESWSGWPRPQDDIYFGKFMNADPVFVVAGNRRAG